MKIRRNSFLFVLTLSLTLFISPLVGVFWSSPAQAVCVDTPWGEVCHQDLDPTRVIPGSAQAVEQLWGEAGAGAYQSAAEWMRTNNGSSQGLDTLQKQYLRPHFGDLVDRVAVVYNANLMDEWSALGYRINLGNSAAQTYCNRVYVDDPYQQGDLAQIVLLAHELTHSRQCENYGGAGTFGFHYFREYKRAGENYANNRLEREAFAFEDQFSAWLDTQSVATLPSGLYRFPDGSFVSSNGEAFCTYISPAHFEFSSGRYDQIVQIDETRYETAIAQMANHGACAVRLPAGAYRLVDGRIIASNGNAYCRYVSYEHYERRDRRPIRQFNGEIPLHAMENHFDCAQ